MIGGITIILLCLVMGWLVLISGIEYRRYIKQELLLEKVAKLEAEKEELKKPKSIGDEMTMEQVNAMIADFEFWEMVQKCVVEGKCDDKPMENTGYVEVLSPCVHHDCAAHVTRADCCHNVTVGEDGKEYCITYVNINKLCGLPETEKPKQNDPSRLTDEEIKQLAK